MEKKPNSKNKSFEKELEDLIEENKNRSNGIKKIIKSFDNKNENNNKK